MTLEWTTCAVCVILGLAALFKNVTGFGFSLCAAPLLILLLPPSQSVPLLVIVETVIGMWLWSRLKIRVRIQRLIVLCGFAICGMVIGTHLLQRLDENLLRVMVGFAVLFTAAVLWRGGRIPLSNTKAGLAAVGGLSGLLGGTTAMSGPPIVIFFDETTQDSAEFRAHCIAYFTITYAVQSVWLTYQNVVTLDVLLQAFAGVAVAGLSLWVSRDWHQRIGGSAFRRLSLGLLGLSGITAAVMGAVQLFVGV